MDIFCANPNKKILIEVNGKTFSRHAIKTHFITPQENYLEIIRSYASPLYQPGDILSISEKIISVCQNRIVDIKEVKLGFWAKFLSQFVLKTTAGWSVGNPYKMQVAINLAGLLRILFAASCAALTKPLGIKGVFYKVAGHGISGIDGFYGGAFDWYKTKGILGPHKPNKVCDEIQTKLGIACMIVDANDLGIKILGCSKNVGYSHEELKAMIKDNPAGQDNEQTPLILIRPNINTDKPHAWHSL